MKQLYSKAIYTKPGSVMVVSISAGLDDDLRFQRLENMKCRVC